MVANIIWLGLIFILSAIPLNIAVKLLGGHSGLFKTAIINFFAGLLFVVVKQYAPAFGTVAGFVATLILYKFAFGLGFIKAFFVWVLSGVIVAVFFMLFALFIGVTLFI